MAYLSSFGDTLSYLIAGRIIVTVLHPILNFTLRINIVKLFSLVFYMKYLLSI